MEDNKKDKKARSKKIWLLVIMISILLVPAFYSFTYLKSYWNDMTAINKVPIAVVNLDQPYTKDGKTYNVGQTVVNNLKDNNVMNWKFVNYKQGMSGLYGTKYYAMIVIPKNFSQEIADASTDGFKKPELEFYQNQGKNYIFSEISTVAATQIQQNVAQSISKSVSNVLVQTIYTTKNGFKTAADGVNTLQSGMDKLTSGSQSLTSGVSKLASGATKLNGGVDKLQNGSTQLVSGIDKLQDGGTQLVNGVNKLQNGSSSLVNGVNQLQNGASSLSGGMQKLEGGSQKVASGAQALEAGSQSLENGMQSLQSGASKIKEGQIGVSQEVQELQMLIAKGDTKAAAQLASKIESQTVSLGQATGELSSGIQQASNGASNLNSGLNTLGNGAQALSSGIQSAANGANKLNNGLQQVSSGAQALNGGLSQVETGANALNSGLSSAKTGAEAINGGLGSVNQGVSALSSGLNSADSGASQLSSGLVSAGKGVSKLGSGLESGYQQLNKNVTFSAEDMSNFISNPVTLKTIELNPVSSYGEGFAPFFMCIGAFVGAMYVYFITSALSRKFKGSFKRRFIRMFIQGSIACIIQSVIMTALIYYGLGMTAESVPWLFGVNMLTAVAFYSLMNGLHYIITPIMKGALVVIMVLQFTSCAGTYPIEVMPKFYQIIHPLIPMSYSVTALRMAIAGKYQSVFNNCIWFLVGTIVITTIIGFIVGYLRNHIEHRRVMREKSELIAEEEVFNQYV